MMLSKVQAADILGIHPTNFARSTNSRWYKAVTPDGKVDMSIAYKIKEEIEKAREYAEKLKSFSIYLKEHWNVQYREQSELTGVCLICLYSLSYDGKRLEPLTKLYPKAWKEFNEYELKEIQ